MYAESWHERGIVSIGWDFGDADILCMIRNQIRSAHAGAHPTLNHGQVGQATSQVSKFALGITKESTVVTYDPGLRLYRMGEVTGGYEAAEDMDGITYVRTVQWNFGASRDLLSSSTKNSLGSLTTIFSLTSEVIAELKKAAGVSAPPSSSKEAVPVDDDGDEDEGVRYATFDDGIERIEDRVLQLSWEEVEQLVAGLFRSMGYNAQITPKGPDGGGDVVASPDALGLESPRIIAEVKHRKGAMGATQIRSFIGGLRAGDRGLYLGTGGFSKEARYEADRANVPMGLLDLDGLVRLYVDSYDKADEEIRSIFRSFVFGGMRRFLAIKLGPGGQFCPAPSSPMHPSITSLPCNCPIHSWGIAS